MASQSHNFSDTASDEFGDYDLVSDPRSIESSIADLTELSHRRPLPEIPPTSEATITFDTVTLTADHIQELVSRNIRGGNERRIPKGERTRSRSRGPFEKTYRVYVDGLFDVLTIK